ncbi:MAG: hypothetical protein DSM106950_26390 [Stigonema ocellatum SAG 48.90 = DSM 106950]|nr:hypothetical protein [Stigonema ocellatum SAG 48.90 = DSM 106950]
MLRKKIGRILLSTVVVVTTVVSIVVDWNGSHVFNPAWVPHARFHDVMLLVTLIGIMGVSLWLLWRESAEPDVNVRAVALLQIFFWGSFYVAVFIPGASPAAFINESPPQLAGIPLYPNMVIAVICIVLAVLADWLYHTGETEVKNQSETASK